MEKITIPGPGEKKRLNLSGLSVAILMAESFDSISDVPKISFNQVSERYPITTGSTYPYDDCGFEKLVIEGTAAAEGSIVYLAALNVCAEFKVVWDHSTIKQKSGNTFVKDWAGDSNTVKGFDEMEITDENGNLPVSLYVEARNADIIYRSNDGDGTDPDNQVETDSFLLPADTGEQKEIEGEDFFLNAKFTNAVLDEEPKLIVWPRYR